MLQVAGRAQLEQARKKESFQYPAIFYDDLDVWENERQQFDAAGEIREKSNTAGRSQTTCPKLRKTMHLTIAIIKKYLPDPYPLQTIENQSTIIGWLLYLNSLVVIQFLISQKDKLAFHLPCIFCRITHTAL